MKSTYNPKQFESYQHKIFQLKNDFKLDFNRLALQNPALRKHVIILGHRTVINFKKQQSLIELTKAIMNSVFGIKWRTLPQSLCPRIPNRLNYLLWIHRHSQVNIKSVIDIGTGSSIIYPLIGWKIFDWNFIGTEIDQQSIDNAKKIIAQNFLQQKIKITKGSQDYLLKQVINFQQQHDLVVCNPPFFDNQNFLSPLGQMKEREHRTQGGQYQFFFNMYLESLYFTNIKIFTMMLGRQTTFEQIKHFLQQQVAQNICQTVKFGKIHQGSNTRFIIWWKINQKLVKQLQAKDMQQKL